MRSWFVAISIVLLVVCSASAQHTYMLTGHAFGSSCGNLNASVGGKSWTFPLDDNGLATFTESVTFAQELTGTTVITYYFNGDATCCPSWPFNDCGVVQSRPMQVSNNCWNLWTDTGSWELVMYFTKLTLPVIVSEQCDYLRIGTPEICSNGPATYWYVTNDPATNQWAELGAAYLIDVSPALITAKTTFDPYGPLFIRYRHNGIDYRDPVNGGWSSPSESLPIRLFHAAPKMTPAPTHQLCTTISGVTLTNTQLLLPKVRISIRREITPGVWQNVLPDTEYDKGSVEGMFYALAPGKYELAARNWGGTDPTDVCPATFAFEITGTYPTVDIQSSVVDEVCFGAAGTGSITLTPGGSNITPPYTYAWAHDGTLTAKDLTGLAGDVTYHVKVTDKNGCTGEKDIPVKEPDAIVITEAHQSAPVSCPANTVGNKSDGVIHLEATGGTGTLWYRLTGAAHTAPYQSAGDFSNLPPDVYTVYVKDGQNCEVQHTTPVPLTAPGDIRHTGMDVAPLRCNGLPEGTITIVGARGGNGGLQYTYDMGTYQTSNTLTNLTSGSHIVSIRDSKGCRRDTTVSVGQPAAITFSAFDLQPQSCTSVVDGIITALAVGGKAPLQYALEDSPTAYQDEGKFTDLSSGSHTVYVRDSVGCIAFQTRFLPLVPVMTGGITVSKPISCRGENDGALRVNVTGGGTAPYTTEWIGIDTTAEITGLTAGTYSVIVKDAKTCAQTWNYPLTEPAILTAIPQVSDYEGFGVRCAGGTDGAIDVLTQGGTAPYRYTWSDGPTTTEDRTGLPAGTYTVSVVDDHGCVTTAAGIAVTAPATLSLRLENQKNISCHDIPDGVIRLEATGGAGTYMYTRNTTTWQLDSLFTGLAEGTYTLYVRDGNGCMSNAVQTSLTQPSALVLTLLKKEETTCGQANGMLEIGLAGGVGNYTYAWYNETNDVIATTPRALQLTSGDYRLIGKDGNACVAEQTFSINDSDGPQVSQTLLQDLTCHDSDDGAISVSVSEGLAPYTISWDVAGEQGLSVDNLTGGEHWIEVLDSRGCRNKRTFWVDYPEALRITPALVLPLCHGGNDGSIEVTAFGGNAGSYTYAWATGETSPRREGLAAGSYVLLVRDSKDCTLRQEIVLDEPALYTVDAGGDRTICRGQQLSIVGPEDAASYRWTSDAGYESTARTVVLTEPAQYTLEVINANGCRAEDHFALTTSDDLLQADFLMAAEAFAGDTIVLVDISWPVPDNVGWAFPAGTQVVETDGVYAAIVLPAAGTYAVTMNSYLGECIDDLVKEITVLNKLPSEGGRTAEALVKRFDIYPNPNDGAFVIQLEFSSPVTGKLAMIGLSGNRMLWQENLSEQTSYEVHPALQQLPAGIYLLMFESGNQRYYKRIIKK